MIACIPPLCLTNNSLFSNKGEYIKKKKKDLTTKLSLNLPKQDKKEKWYCFLQSINKSSYNKVIGHYRNS